VARQLLAAVVVVVVAVLVPQIIMEYLAVLQVQHQQKAVQVQALVAVAFP
jgi:hypothetical protein